MKRATATSNDVASVEKLLDGSEESFTTFKTITESIIDLSIPKGAGAGIGIQSVSIKPLDHGYTLFCNIEISTDGKNYHQIASYSEQRGHQGPGNKDPILIPFPETKAEHSNNSKRIHILSIKALSKAIKFSNKLRGSGSNS